MARPDALRGPPVGERRAVPRGADNPLVRAVARIPWRVRTKLLVAFVGIVALFVVVGLLGVRALGQSNARVERLGTLQLRAATYRGIQTQSQQLRQLLGLRVGANNPSQNIYNGVAPNVLGGRHWTLVDQTIATAVSQLAPATNESRFGFVPPPEDESLLGRIRLDYRRFSRALKTIIANDQAGAPAAKNQPILGAAVSADNDLGALTDRLATRTRAQTDALVAQNRSAYASSRNLFIGLGAASVVLALLLGLVLSWSVIGPIQRTEERLAEIASGDFSKHVDVPNRDEFGALATNLNRMNDELGRLHEAREAQAAQLTDLNRTLESRVVEQTEELRASRSRVVSAADAERRRIERDLHDGAQQHLVSLAVHLRLARDLADSDPNKAREILEELGDDVQATLEEVRDLAHGIYPPLLQDRGLAEALAAAAGRATIPTRVDASQTGRYDAVVEATVYFCCLEALQNAAKHAGAGASAVITVREDDGGLRFEVVDDGAGFDASGARGGVGLTNMRDRVGAVGGTIRLESTVGRGTTLAGLIPLGDGPWT
jgi:signal transduction histidine kinase